MTYFGRPYFGAPYFGSPYFAGVDEDETLVVELDSIPSGEVVSDIDVILVVDLVGLAGTSQFGTLSITNPSAPPPVIPPIILPPIIPPVIPVPPVVPVVPIPITLDGMLAEMMARAASAGLINVEPHFALLRVYRVMATAVTETLLSPTGTILTTIYGPGQPALGFGTAGITVGLDGLDPDRFALAVQNASGFVGPQAGAFFKGVAGIVSYTQRTATFLDLFAPTGNGTGMLPPGGITFMQDPCFDRMKEEAEDEEIMVVRTGLHVPDDLTPIVDPTTNEPLLAGDLFSQARKLLLAVSSCLTTELLNGTKAGIPVVGSFDPLAPTIVSSTVTARFL